MTVKKKTIHVERFPNVMDSNENTVFKYRVTKVINEVVPSPGDEIDKTEVDKYNNRINTDVVVVQAKPIFRG